jgi:Gram-negative porin
MNGAPMRGSSCCFAIAALGLFVGVGISQAADLGGNCCADLEERIAELEATAARKGNRKMSLTISGQVDRVVAWYDDGKNSTTYYGLDNTNSSSRFVFSGNAKVTPKVSMGFEIMIEDEAGGGTTSKVSQLDEDGKLTAFVPSPNIAFAPGVCVSGTTCGAVGTPSFNAHNIDGYFADARHVAWWIEHADLGRLTVGRWDGARVPVTIDLTGHIFLPANASFTLLNGGFFMRGPSGQFYTLTWGNIVDPAIDPIRTELVRYDSPSFMGFIYSASLAEAGDYWGTMIRYANEFNGVRIGGGIGYERVTDIATPGVVDPSNVAYVGNEPDITAWGFALSILHVPTGLFVQGHYNHFDFGDRVIGAPSGYWGESTVNKKPADQWLIQAGISKNFFGYGNTSVYSEYGEAGDWGADFTNGSGLLGRTYAAAANTVGFTALAGVTATEVRMWGLGVAQNVSAAATDLYAGYRHFNADVTCTDATAAVCSGGVAVGTTGIIHRLPTNGIDVIVMGARVLF